MQDSKMETPLGNGSDTGADAGSENRGGNPENGNSGNGRETTDPHGNRRPGNGNCGRGPGPRGGPGSGYYNQGGPYGGRGYYNQGGACGGPGCPPPPPYEPGPGGPPPEMRRPLSVLSVVGFVFVFLNSLVGLILSIIAYNAAKEERDFRSMKLSKSGIIVAAVLLAFDFLVVSVVILVVVLSFAGGLFVA